METLKKSLKSFWHDTAKPPLKVVGLIFAVWAIFFYQLGPRSIAGHAADVWKSPVMSAKKKLVSKELSKVGTNIGKSVANLRKQIAGVDEKKTKPKLDTRGRQEQIAPARWSERRPKDISKPFAGTLGAAAPRPTKSSRN